MSTRMGLCLRFRSKKNKYGTIVHPGPKNAGKLYIFKLGFEGTFLAFRKCKKGDFCQSLRKPVLHIFCSCIITNHGTNLFS